jgi:hypothetical protein
MTGCEFSPFLCAVLAAVAERERGIRALADGEPHPEDLSYLAGHVRETHADVRMALIGLRANGCLFEYEEEGKFVEGQPSFRWEIHPQCREWFPEAGRSLSTHLTR